MMAGGAWSPIMRQLLLSLAMTSLAAGALAADVTGRWDILISTPEGPVRGLASLKQADGEVTGWVGKPERDGWVGSGEHGPIPVTGAFKKGKLVLKTLPEPEQAPPFDEVVLSIKGDTMTGVLDRGARGRDGIKLVRSR
jgi:hypothetical protein